MSLNMDKFLLFVSDKIPIDYYMQVGIHLGVDFNKIKIIEREQPCSSKMITILQYSLSKSESKTEFIESLKKSLSICKCNSVLRSIGIYLERTDIFTSNVAKSLPLKSNQAEDTESLLNIIKGLEPALKKNNERSNSKQYLVAVEIFSGNLPTTETCIDDLPYVIALFSKIPENSVIKWQGCPSVSVLRTAYETYLTELECVQQELQALDKCGICINAVLGSTFEKVSKIIETFYKVKIGDIFRESLCLDDLSQKENNLVCIIYHLLTRCGKNLSFIMRKDFMPKPPAYLIFNTKTLPIGVVREEHLSIVQNTITSDESCNISDDMHYTCPF